MPVVLLVREVRGITSATTLVCFWEFLATEEVFGDVEGKVENRTAHGREKKKPQC